MTISSLEHALTVHVRTTLTRHVATPNLKLFSFTVSLLSCLFVGAVLTISIFTPYFTQELGYSQFKINLIGSFISLGMYLPLPVLGYLADYHGPVVLSVLSLIMSLPGYMLVSVVYKYHYRFETMLVAFLLVGCGTSLLYFTCLLTCAKIYPHFKSLSISGPITCYGLSSFIISKMVLSCAYFHLKGSQSLDVSRIFAFFAVLFVILSFLNWISASIVTIEKDVIFEDTETAPLLDDRTPPNTGHNSKFQTFLKDKSMYLLLMSLLLCVGPLESFIVNISSFSQVLSLDNSEELIKFSFFSTFARLFFGILLELVHANLSTKIVLILLILLLQLAGSILTYQTELYPVAQWISSLFGVAYGGIFTIYPTILANIWGVDIFGSTWGLFMLAPLFGSIIFGLVYGAQYDQFCRVVSAKDAVSDYGYNCLYTTFSLVSSGLVLACGLIVAGWHFCWRHRDL